MDEPAFWVGVLGPLSVRVDGAARPITAARQRAVLATLLLRANEILAVDEMADTVWDGRPPAGARATIRNYVRLLRHALGSPGVAHLRTESPGYLFRASEQELDWLAFTSLCRSGHASLSAGAWREASDTLSRALALWRGPVLADVPSQTIHRSYVPALERLRLQATGWRIDADLRLGRHESLITELERLATAHPLNEHFHVQLMLALAGASRRAEALDAYRRARQAVVAELGIEPGPEMRRVHHAILAGEDDLRQVSPPGGDGTVDWRPDRAAAPGTATRRPQAAPPTDMNVPTGTDQPVPHQLPPVTRHFTGRADQLAELAGTLEADPTRLGPVIVAITGMAGVGKTALAIRFAHQVATRFPDGQLFVNLDGFDKTGSPLAPGDVIRGLLGTFGIPTIGIPPDPQAQVGMYRSLLAGRRVVLVLDNARDAEQVQPLLPGTSGCLVVVTSRNDLTGLVAAQGAHRLALDVLPANQSRLLLSRHIGNWRTAAEPAATAELAAVCGGLPLALTIAAAQAVVRPAMRLSQLAGQLRDARARLDLLDAGDAHGSVRTVFSWSYVVLSPGAARLFRMLGLAGGPDICLAAVTSLSGEPPETVSRALSELVHLHLVESRVPGRYEMHDLVRRYAAELSTAQDDDERRRRAVNRLLDHAVHTGYAAAEVFQPGRTMFPRPGMLAGVCPQRPGDHAAALAWFESERRSLMAVLDLAVEYGFDTHAWQLAWVMAPFLDRCSHWSDWMACERAGLAAAQRLGDRYAEAAAHQRLGRLLTRRGAPEEAEAHLCRALAGYECLEDLAAQARCHLGLACLRDGQGRLDNALSAAERASHLFQVAGDAAGQVDALGTVGWIRARLGQHEAAIADCRRALSLYRELDDRLGQARVWDTVGYAYHRLGRPRGAIACFRRSLTLLCELDDRPHLAEVSVHLGDVYAASGQPTLARKTWQRALDGLDGLHHPLVAQLRARIGAA